MSSYGPINTINATKSELRRFSINSFSWCLHTSANKSQIEYFFFIFLQQIEGIGSFNGVQLNHKSLLNKWIMDSPEKTRCSFSQGHKVASAYFIASCRCCNTLRSRHPWHFVVVLLFLFSSWFLAFFLVRKGCSFLKLKMTSREAVFVILRKN